MDPLEALRREFGCEDDPAEWQRTLACAAWAPRNSAPADPLLARLLDAVPPAAGAAPLDYETWLAGKDPGTRKALGVYHTPRPVADYIVKSLDQLTGGLAAPGIRVIEPSCGTGVFLESVRRLTGARRLYGSELMPSSWVLAQSLLTDAQIQLGSPLEFPAPGTGTPVILGNPPYSNFGGLNRGPRIRELMSAWRPTAERKWNPDDYMKFLRWAEWNIAMHGSGFVGFVTRSTFLDGLTHGRMRESLLDTFSDLYILDLHGSLRDREKNENVFGIQWGVAISLFAKHQRWGRPTEIHYAELDGTRAEKFAYLDTHDVASTRWNNISTRARWTPGHSEEDPYFTWPAIDEIFGLKNSGIQTKRDALCIQPTREELETVITDLRTRDEEEIRQKYGLGPDGPAWSIARAQADVRNHPGQAIPILYRPFDQRWTYFTGRAGGFLGRPRSDVTRQMLSRNLALVCPRQIAGTEDDCQALVSRTAVTDRCFRSTRGTPYLFPLWVDGSSNLRIESPADPEEFFAYVYAILWAPGYRQRYRQHLRTAFPRIPLTRQPSMFRELARCGRRLIAVHLLEVSGSADPLEAEYCIGGYPVSRPGADPRVPEAIRQTLRIQAEIDEIAGAWPLV